MSCRYSTLCGVTCGCRMMIMGHLTARDRLTGTIVTVPCQWESVHEALLRSPCHIIWARPPWMAEVRKSQEQYFRRAPSCVKLATCRTLHESRHHTILIATGSKARGVAAPCAPRGRGCA